MTHNGRLRINERVMRDLYLRIPTKSATYSDLNPATPLLLGVWGCGQDGHCRIPGLNHRDRTLPTSRQAGPTVALKGGRFLIGMGGRMISESALYLFEVKSPAASKAPWDYFKELRVIPADEAFRPLDQGGCPLVNQAATKG